MSARFRGECLRVGIADAQALSSRDLGQPVTDHRSSWVRRARIGSIDVFIKTYDYPGVRDKVRGLLRTTFLAASRAERERQALCWMRERGFAAPEPMAVLEQRRFGVLRRAVLVTEAWPGTPLPELLATTATGERDALLRTLEATVESLHREGFRDGNLDLRNLLARQTEDGSWEVAKIDSPRHRLVAAGGHHDRRARDDWERLSRSLTNAGHSR